jgi:hypothetical protein
VWFCGWGWGGVSVGGRGGWRDPSNEHQTPAPPPPNHHPPPPPPPQEQQQQKQTTQNTPTHINPKPSTRNNTDTHPKPPKHTTHKREGAKIPPTHSPTTNNHPKHPHTNKQEGVKIAVTDAEAKQQQESSSSGGPISSALDLDAKCDQIIAALPAPASLEGACACGGAVAGWLCV